MSRWVIPRRANLRAATPEAPEGPIGRIVKYIPGEIVSAYTVLFGGLAALQPHPAPPGARPAAVALIGVFLVTTIAYVALRTPAGSVRKAHLAVSPIAFLAWAYPISSSLLGDWFLPLLAFGMQVVVISLSIVVVPKEA